MNIIHPKDNKRGLAQITKDEWDKIPSDSKGCIQVMVAPYMTKIIKNPVCLMYQANIWCPFQYFEQTESLPQCCCKDYKVEIIK